MTCGCTRKTRCPVAERLYAEMQACHRELMYLSEQPNLARVQIIERAPAGVRRYRAALRAFEAHTAGVPV